MTGPIDLNHGSASMASWVGFVSSAVDFTHDLDLGFSNANFEIAILSNGRNYEWKKCESIGCWTHYVTLNCDLTTLIFSCGKQLYKYLCLALFVSDDGVCLSIHPSASPGLSQHISLLITMIFHHIIANTHGLWLPNCQGNLSNFKVTQVKKSFMKWVKLGVSGECMRGIAWDLAVWCIVTNCRTGHILIMVLIFLNLAAFWLSETGQIEVSFYFMETACGEWPEIWHAAVSWQPSELIRSWSWHVDFFYFVGNFT